MWYLRALSVAVVAVPLVVGTGCVTQQTYNRDIQTERSRTAMAQKDLAQAKTDLKKAYDSIADLSAKAANLDKVQQQLAAAEKRADGLQASIKVEVEKARKTQEHADAEKAGALTRSREALTKELTKAHQEIAALKKEVAKLKKEEMTPPPTPPVRPPVTPPAMPPVATPPAAPVSPN